MPLRAGGFEILARAVEAVSVALERARSMTCSMFPQECEDVRNGQLTAMEGSEMANTDNPNHSGIGDFGDCLLGLAIVLLPFAGHHQDGRRARCVQALRPAP